MISKRRVTAVLMVLVILISAFCVGCNGKATVKTDNNDPLSGVDYPMVIFGEDTVSNGMSYTLDSKKEMKIGSIIGKEYVKFEPNMTLSFKIDDKYAKKLSGKNLFIRFEYYESSSKSFVVGYEDKKGKKSETLEMSGSSNWGGRVIKAKAVKLDNQAKAHFTLKLDRANSMWLRSVSVIEDTTKEQTYPQLIKTDYETSNGKIIEANVKDYGAVGDGKVDDSLSFQTALREMAGKGGVLYVPSGTYKLTQDLIVPKGVTVLGDFNKPSVEKSKVGGTILAAYVPTIADGSTSLFMSLDQGSSVNGLTVWYPEQTLSSGEAEPYNYTIGILGPIGVSVENIYLVNSYDGITHASFDGAHYQQMLKNIYGTPLHTGYLAGRASDSDRQQNINFNPKYWLGSGLENIPDENVLRTWLLKYGTGMRIGKIDFHYVSDINVDGYKIGMHMFGFYGRLYNLNITNCNVCIYAEGISQYGGQLTKAVLKANGGKDPVALLVGEGTDYGFSGTMLEISSTGKYAISHLGKGAMSITDSKITVTGKDSVAPLYVADGRISMMNCEFDGGANHISLGKDVDESSVFNCTASSGNIKVDDNTQNMLTIGTNENNVGPLAADVLNIADEKRDYQDKGPEKLKLFNIADYGVLEGDQPEIGEVLQKSIDAAADNGGGLVYVPAGVYRLENPVTVKSGVEIVGVTDYFHYINSSIPSSTILTDYGKSGAKEPLIKLEENSGIRGLSIIYDKVTQETIQLYTPTVQATGKDCYTINTTIVGAWDAVDYNTYKCDNHYIESVNFFAFNKGIAIGGGSTGGVQINGHTNPGELWSTGYNKYKWTTGREEPLMLYLLKNTIPFYYGDCTDETVFMNALFGAKYGVMVDGADVVIIGVGIDYSTNDIYITDDSNVTVIDPQCIGANTRDPYTSTAIVCDSKFTGTANVYNMCPWNINDTAIRVDGGNFSINGGHFLHSGRSPLIVTGGNALMRGVIVRNRSVADLQALTSAKSVIAYGNIIYGTPTFKIDSSVKYNGSDLKE